MLLFFARLIALPVFALVAWGLIEYPLGNVYLGVGLVIYALALIRFPFVWLFVLPALLPVLNFAPWTGRFFFDAFDMFVLVTIAVGYLRVGEKVGAPLFGRVQKTLLLLFFAGAFVSTLMGLLPLQSLDFNAFANYYSRFNSLRVFKGFFYALALWPLFRRASFREHHCARKFIGGVLVGLAGVCLVALWERQVFSGLINFSSDFRITSTFYGMHTGGAYIDGFLTATLPLIGWCFLAQKNRLIKLGGLLLFPVAIYTLLVTFSRIDYLAFGVSLLTLLLTLGVAHTNRKRFLALVVVACLIAAALALPILRAPYIQARFERTGQDIDTRLSHWEDGLRMMQGSMINGLFGEGLGSYPRIYYRGNSEGIKPATFEFRQEKDNTFLRLTAGDSLYYGQKIALRPHEEYRIQLAVRSADPKAMLNIPICEKSLLHSYGCEWLRFDVGDTQGRWLEVEHFFSSDGLGKGNPVYQRRPVELALYNGRSGTSVDVDNLQLFEHEAQQNLIRNGGFSAGGDFWFFTVDNHMPWHVKNIGIHLIIEHGWFGFSLFLLFTVGCMVRLFSKGIRGNVLACLFLASFLGFFTVGMIDSLFDEPRITLFYFLLMFAAMIACKDEDQAQRSEGRC